MIIWKDPTHVKTKKRDIFVVVVLVFLGAQFAFHSDLMNVAAFCALLTINVYKG